MNNDTCNPLLTRVENAVVVDIVPDGVAEVELIVPDGTTPKSRVLLTFLCGSPLDRQGNGLAFDVAAGLAEGARGGAVVFVVGVVVWIGSIRPS